jgi:hypothetical protein
MSRSRAGCRAANSGKARTSRTTVSAYNATALAVCQSRLTKW